MIIIDKELMTSEYITVDEKGWHCSENAPEDIKRKFEDFMEKTSAGIDVVIEE